MSTPQTSYDPASYDSQFGTTLPLDYGSTSPVPQPSASGSSGGSSSMSASDLNALFGGGSLSGQGTDPLAYLGSPSYVTQSSGTPSASSDLTLIGKTINQAGQLFQYVAGTLNGQPAAVPQQVPSSTVTAGKSNMGMLLIAGLAALLLLKK